MWHSSAITFLVITFTVRWCRLDPDGDGGDNTLMNKKHFYLGQAGGKYPTLTFTLTLKLTRFYLKDKLALPYFWSLSFKVKMQSIIVR